MAVDISPRFPRYTTHGPEVPVWCITPSLGGCIHRFFDTSPISPSGRYAALTQLPFEDRVPQPGDEAAIVLVDLANGYEEVIAHTRGWDTQLGAQVQWGADDTQLLFNDLDTDAWHPYCVVLDPTNGGRRELEWPVYMASADGTRLASPDLRKTGLTQKGYGVIVPAEHVEPNTGAPDDDGLFVTDVATGRSRLLVSLRQIVETAEPAFDPERHRRGDFYGFHVKWNPQGDRLMFVIRWKPHDGSRMRPSLITMNADGSGVGVPIPDELWGRGGHHPNWCPDGEHVMMNLKADGEHMRLVRARYDGTGFSVMTDAVLGSGHPAMHPDARHVVTDAYLSESLAFGDGTTPIRWLDVAEGTERNLVRMNTDPPFRGPVGELRIDPHPAWDREYRRIVFNGCDAGVRRVYLADLAGIL